MLFAALAACLCASAFPAAADGIEVREARLRSTDEGLVLDADFEFQLSPRLADVVANGVPLYFEVEFVVTRSRWYWFDEQPVSKRLQVRLSYHALSRQYRLSTGLLQLSFPTLDEALGGLKKLRGWLVAERGVVLSDAAYEAALRMRLDTSLLPKPLQLSALTSRDLHLESDWLRFPLEPGKAGGE